MERPIQKLSELMDGGVEERFNAELARVWQNIYDPNTDPRRTRTVTMQVKITPNERRDACDFKVSCSSKLAPYQDLSQTVMLELQQDGSIRATERTDQIPGQVDMDGNVQPLPKVINFNQ